MQSEATVAMKKMSSRPFVVQNTGLPLKRVHAVDSKDKHSHHRLQVAVKNVPCWFYNRAAMHRHAVIETQDCSDVLLLKGKFNGPGSVKKYINTQQSNPK